MIGPVWGKPPPKRIEPFKVARHSPKYELTIEHYDSYFSDEGALRELRLVSSGNTLSELYANAMLETWTAGGTFIDEDSAETNPNAFIAITEWFLERQAEERKK
jgi:hypothetical protein